MLQFADRLKPLPPHSLKGAKLPTANAQEGIQNDLRTTVVGTVTDITRSAPITTQHGIAYGVKAQKRLVVRSEAIPVPPRCFPTLF